MTNWGYVGAKAPLLSTTPPYAIVTCDSGGMQRHPMFIRTHFLLSWPKGPVACRDQRGLLHLSRKCQRLPAETMKSLVSTVRLKGPVACRDQRSHLHLSWRCQRPLAETTKKSLFYLQTQGSGSTQRPTWSSAPFLDMSASSDRYYEKVSFVPSDSRVR